MTLPKKPLRAAPNEEPLFVVRGPVSGQMIEVVDRRTYDRVVAAYQCANREMAQAYRRRKG